MSTDTMFGWLPYFGAISALVLLTAALDTLHAIRRDLARLRREATRLQVVEELEEAA